MAKRCATLEEVLDQALDCRSFGDPSSGTITFADNPADGTTFTVTNDLWTFPPEVATLTARPAAPGVGEYLIGANASETAANFAAKVNDAAEAMGSLVMASVSGAVVTISTAAEGPESMFKMETSAPADLVLSGDTLEGGDAMVEHARACACKAINLDCWGDKASCGHIYLTAHLCSVADSGERGPVNAKTIDKISVSYAAVGTATGLDAHFSTTKWGRLYLSMKSTLLVMPVVGRRTLLRPPGC